MIFSFVSADFFYKALACFRNVTTKYQFTKFFVLLVSLERIFVTQCYCSCCLPYVRPLLAQTGW